MQYNYKEVEEKWSNYWLNNKIWPIEDNMTDEDFEIYMTEQRRNIK